MTAPLRIHIQSDAAHGFAAPTPEAVAEALADRPDLAARLSITTGSGAALPPEAADAEILYAAAALSPGAARAVAPGLKWMQITMAGVEKFVGDLPADLALTNASGVHSEKGGEFILAAALMLNYEIPRFIENKAARRWDPVFGPTLRRRRVTLLGVGRIGGAAAALLKAAGAHVTGITRSGRSDAPLDACLPVSALDEALAETDILAASLPLTKGTDGLVDRRRVDLLPQGAGVINVGRARVFDTDALYDRLDAGTLSGAVLDVFPTEPLPQDDRAWTTPRLIVSPHCSVDDHTVYRARCVEIFADNLVRYAAGTPLDNLVDPAAGY